MRSMIVVVMLAAGCATPYGPRGLMGGYAEQQMSEDEWWLEVNGNGFTSTVTLNFYFERRARELCGGRYVVGRVSQDVERGGATYSVQRGQVVEHPGYAKGYIGGMIRCVGSPQRPPAAERCTMDAECPGAQLCEQGRCRE